MRKGFLLGFVLLTSVCYGQIVYDRHHAFSTSGTSSAHHSEPDGQGGGYHEVSFNGCVDLAYGNDVVAACGSTFLPNPFRTLTHYDANDEIVWTLDSIRVHDMEHDDTGGIVFIGDAHIQADLDPGPSVAIVPGGLKIVASYRADGTLRFAHRLPSGSTYFQRIALDKDGSAIALGAFDQAFDLDPSSEVQWIEPLTPSGHSYFLARYDSLGVLLDHQVIYSPNMAPVEHVILANYKVHLLCRATNPGGLPIITPIQTLTDIVSIPRSSPYAFLFLTFDQELELTSTHVVDCSSDGGIGSRLFKLGQDRMLLYGQGSQPIDVDPGPATVGLPNAQRFIAEYGQEWQYHWSGDFPIGAVHVSDAALDSGNQLYIAGTFQGTCDIDPNEGEVIEIGVTTIHGFVTKLSSARQTEWALRIGGDAFVNLKGMYVNQELVLHFAGNGVVDVQPGVGSVLVECSNVATGAAIVHYTINELTTATTALPPSIDLRIFPNPASNLVYIEAPAPFDLTLFDAHGRLIISKTYNDMRSSLQVADLAEGLYVVQVRTTNSIVSRTLVVQH